MVTIGAFGSAIFFVAFFEASPPPTLNAATLEDKADISFEEEDTLLDPSFVVVVVGAPDPVLDDDTAEDTVDVAFNK